MSQDYSGPPPLSPEPPLPAQTSGLAIASLIFGILFFIPFAPIVAIILGIIALVKISNSKGAIAGQGLAIAGLCLGGIFFLISCTILPAMLLPALSRARNVARATSSKNNLKQLGLAVLMSNNDNSGMMAPDLQTLHAGQYFRDFTILRHPGSGSTIDGRDLDATSDYFYFPLSVSESEAPPIVPIMWEKHFWYHDATSVNVLFIDGHVSLHTLDELRTAVDRYADLYVNPPEMPTPPD